MVDPLVFRNRIARIIAATRFPFVNQENWPESRKTIVNDETKRFGIKWGNGILYPNIVIFDSNGNIYEFGLVELSENIIEESVPRWRTLSNCVSRGRKYKKLFLYVPKDLEKKTADLLDRNKIDYDGIRAFSIVEGSLRITPYITRNDEYDHQVT